MIAVTTVPHIEIELDNQALTPESMGLLEEVRIQHRLSQPSLCELRFVVGRDPVPDLQNLGTGSRMTLTLPSSGRLFDGEITALEFDYSANHDRTIRVRCYDMLHRLRKRQPVRVHVQVTPSELARQMAEDIGLSVEADADGPVTQRLIQFRQSDLDLLVQTSQRFGLFLTLRDDTLHLVNLVGIGETIELELGTSLIEARVEVNAEPACRSVLAKGWDTCRTEPHEARANSTNIGREVDAEAPPDRFGMEGAMTLADELLPNDLHATAVAQAELDLRTAREVTLSGIAEGNTDLLPGSRVEVYGLAKSFSGRYVLTSVTHVINRRTGFVSEISSVPPSTEKRSTAANAIWGTVTNVDDPDKLGRVRVSFPSLGEIETDWLGVMSAGAGSGKGFVILPDIGDDVLVLCVGGDLAHGIVLGGLFGTKNPGDYGVEGTSIRRYLLGTPGGQKIRLDDTGQSIRIENKGGSFLELSPEKALLHSVVDLQIEAPGRAVAITGKTIDFRQA